MSSEKDPQEKPSIIIDDDWKSQVEKEREQLKQREAGTESAADPSKAEPDAASAESHEADPGEMPPASFVVLLMTLATQALTALGQVPGPDGKTMEPQLPIAKHLIDTIGMLEEKTRGNLDEQESALLTQSLNELRLAYVSAAKQGK